ncbi:hypothetical protein F5146DRAFT_1142597 [Armillaria mellea]|nr:hypothetical protein F5146DRAFT_1142597 [Armillaria mellea]
MPLSVTPRVQAMHLKELVDQTEILLADTHRLKLGTVDARWQLSSYSDETLIDNTFSINTTNSEEFVYLIWKDTQEEVVLQTEGILAEAHHPPVISMGMEYAGKMNDLIQSIVIVSSLTDSLFSRAIQGIEAIYSFMARFNIKVNTIGNFKVGDLNAIHGETQLLMPVGKVRMPIVGIKSIDSGNALKNMLSRGSHQYTEDNVISYLKWEHAVDGKTVISDMNPALLKPGHIVDVGLSFHLIKMPNCVLFQAQLDSCTVMEHGGVEALKVIMKQHQSEEGTSQGPLKK